MQASTENGPKNPRAWANAADIPGLSHIFTTYGSDRDLESLLKRIIPDYESGKKEEAKETFLRQMESLGNKVQEDPQHLIKRSDVLRNIKTLCEYFNSPELPDVIKYALGSLQFSKTDPEPGTSISSNWHELRTPKVDRALHDLTKEIFNPNVPKVPKPTSAMTIAKRYISKGMQLGVGAIAFGTGVVLSNTLVGIFNASFLGSPVSNALKSFGPALHIAVGLALTTVAAKIGIWAGKKILKWGVFGPLNSIRPNNAWQSAVLISAKLERAVMNISSWVDQDRQGKYAMDIIKASYPPELVRDERPKPGEDNISLDQRASLPVFHEGEITELNSLLTVDMGTKETKINSIPLQMKARYVISDRIKKMLMPIAHLVPGVKFDTADAMEQHELSRFVANAINAVRFAHLHVGNRWNKDPKDYENQLLNEVDKAKNAIFGDDVMFPENAVRYKWMGFSIAEKLAWKTGVAVVGYAVVSSFFNWSFGFSTMNSTVNFFKELFNFVF